MSQPDLNTLIQLVESTEEINFVELMKFQNTSNLFRQIVQKNPSVIVRNSRRVE